MMSKMSVVTLIYHRHEPIDLKCSYKLLQILYGQGEQIYGLHPAVYHTVSYMLTVNTTIRAKVSTLTSWHAITNVMTKQNDIFLVQCGTNSIHFSRLTFPGLIWLRIRTQWGFLWTRYWTFGFCKMPGSSSVVAQPADSREGLSCMELVSKLVILTFQFSQN
jgi:hypothetical protein